MAIFVTKRMAFALAFGVAAALAGGLPHGSTPAQFFTLLAIQAIVGGCVVGGLVYPLLGLTREFKGKR